MSISPVDRRARLHRLVRVHEQRGVEVHEDLDGAFVQHRRGAHRVPRERGDRRRVGALAADVAEEEARPAGREREQVVEVAADVLGRRRLVVHGDLEAGDRRQPRRRQGALQRASQLLGAELMAPRIVSQLVLAADLA